MRTTIAHAVLHNCTLMRLCEKSDDRLKHKQKPVGSTETKLVTKYSTTLTHSDQTKNPAAQHRNLCFSTQLPCNAPEQLA
ncbi:MAG: hypothetical protein WAU37_02785 [Formosimonas sp.]